MVATTIAPDPTLIPARPGMSLVDYLARGSERFELINGKEIATSPTGYQHDSLQENLYDNLKAYVKSHHLGQVMIEHTFIDPASTAAKWVTGSVTPDIMFVAGTRVDEYNANPFINPDLPLPLVPELVIEIVSPTDRKAAILEKISYLLALGVQVIWSIKPQRQSVIVYTPDADETVLTGDNVLATDLLPGWSIAVRDLFLPSLLSPAQKD